MRLDLSGKTALVTGSTQGIGQAIAAGLAAAGARVGVNGRSADSVERAIEEMTGELVDRNLAWDEAQREFMTKHRPQSLLQRLIEPHEIAAMVTYLSSPLASATTGGALRVDGGYVDAILP